MVEPHAQVPYTGTAPSEVWWNFHDPRQEWRGVFSELSGTCLLVLVAAGGGMTGKAVPGQISRTAPVVAPRTW
jgi:hypothetical protein